MALAQKARWAKIKGEIEPAQATVAPLTGQSLVIPLRHAGTNRILAELQFQGIIPSLPGKSRLFCEHAIPFRTNQLATANPLNFRTDDRMMSL
jgi:hypothetical protein